METGKIIKELRKRRGISAEQLADILGVAPSTVYRYEIPGRLFSQKKGRFYPAT